MKYNYNEIRWCDRCEEENQELYDIFIKGEMYQICIHCLNRLDEKGISYEFK